MQRACPQCEAPNDTKARVCDQCGFPLEPVTGPEKESPAPPSVQPQTEPRQPAPQSPAQVHTGGREERVVLEAKPRRTSTHRRPIESRPTELDRPIDGFIRTVKSEPISSESRNDQDPWEKSFDELADHTSQVWRETEAFFAEELGPPETPRTTPSLGTTWKLVVVEGFSAGKEYLIFKDTMVVGRRDSDQGVFPDIDLEDQDDGFISRRHAVLRRVDGRLVIEDLGGENGTQIDMKSIEPHQLIPVEAGQVIRLGRVGLLVQTWEPVDGGRSK